MASESGKSMQVFVSQRDTEEVSLDDDDQSVVLIPCS